MLPRSWETTSLLSEFRRNQTPKIDLSTASTTIQIAGQCRTGVSSWPLTYQHCSNGLEFEEWKQDPSLCRILKCPILLNFHGCKHSAVLTSRGLYCMTIVYHSSNQRKWATYGSSGTTHVLGFTWCHPFSHQTSNGRSEPSNRPP